MNLDPIQLITVGHVRPNPDWGMPPHRHPFHEMIAVVSGKVTVTTPHERFTATTGDILFYSAGMTHEEQSDRLDPVHTYFISFHWEGHTPDIPVVVNDPQKRVAWLTQWLFEERYAAEPMMATVRSSAAHAALAEFLRLAAYHEPDMVEQTRQYIRAHLNCDLSIDELANEAQLSKFYFVRMYKKLCGKTPMDDVRRIRVEAARDMLLATNLPLKDIAVRVGLANEYHLSRLVRRYLGMPPGALRRKVTWQSPPAVEEYN